MFGVTPELSVLSHSGADVWSHSGAGVGVWSHSGAGVGVWSHSEISVWESLRSWSRCLESPRSKCQVSLRSWGRCLESLWSWSRCLESHRSKVIGVTPGLE